MTATTEVPDLSAAMRGATARARQHAHVSARALAQACADLGVQGVDRQRIANIEAGRGRPVGVLELLALAYVLRAYPAELVAGEGTHVRVGARTLSRDELLAWFAGTWPAWAQEGDSGLSPGLIDKPVWSLTEAAEIVRKVFGDHGFDVLILPRDSQPAKKLRRLVDGLIDEQIAFEKGQDRG